MNSAAPDPHAAKRFLTGLLGAPIAHSASPAMHERAAAALGLHCHYQLIEVANAGREELRMPLQGVRRLGFAGINVTFPYKEAVLDLLDELSPRAALIGAVNTVVVRDSKLIGHNTDTSGFARAVTGACRRLPAGRRRRDRRRRRRQGDRVCTGRARRWRSCGSSTTTVKRQRRWLPGSIARHAHALPIASTMRCAASPAWSTPPRSGCCPTPARRFPTRCCMPGCGSPMPCIHRSGRLS